MDALTKALLKTLEKKGDALAVWDNGTTFTYSELFDYAFRVMAKLSKDGVKKGDFVTIELSGCKEYMAVSIGVWFLGAVYAALDGGYPVARLDHIASDCHAKVRITEDYLKDIKSYEPMKVFAENRRNDPALLIYTSGSTGKPKGVLHSRIGIYDCFMRYRYATELNENDRAAIAGPFTFVVFIQGMYSYLSAGVPMFLIPDDVKRDPVKLSDFIDEHQITITVISPKMLSLFHQKGNSLRVVPTGSERVVNAWSPNYRIIVLYGSSESVAGVLSFTPDHPYENTPIGKPIGDEQLYLLDENGNEADCGEICLAGHFALGYLNMPEKTAETFSKNPFYERDGYRTLLHTGDLGKRLPDGNILYMNRKDWMVKINGQRVEPGEIEAAIRTVKGVSDAAVKDFTDRYGQVYLAAYFVAKEEIEEDLIREALKDSLPEYMMPRFFTKLQKLPLNMNGKLDRSALPEPEAASFREEYEAPEGEKEKTVCSAFEKVLSLDRVGRDDDFFRIGGDSIKAVMLQGILSGYGITVNEIYEKKTPKDIASILSEEEEKKSERAIRPVGFETPLSPAELGIYLEQKMEPSSTEYNISIGYFISGTDGEKVYDALSKVFSLHEAFRSIYRTRDGVPVRVIADHLPSIERKKGYSYKEAEKEIMKEGEPFDLEKDIPVRAAVYDISKDKVFIHLLMHHIGFDGGSANIIRDELLDILRGNEVHPSLLDLSDIAQLDRTKEYEAGEKYYDSVFKAGVPQNELPVKGSRPMEHPASDSFTESVFDVSTLKSLEEKAAEKSLTLFELLCAALSITVAKYCNSEDVVLGLPSNMRTGEMADVVGMFVNTSPARFFPARDKELPAFLDEVRETVRSATRTASLPFSEIVKKYSDGRDRSHSPIFDVSMNYLTGGEKCLKDGISISMIAPYQKMKRDLGVTLRRQSERLTLNIQYSSKLFEKDLVENFKEQFMSVLLEISKGEAGTIREVSHLPKSQVEWLKNASISGEAKIPVKLLHKVFETVASKNPNKTALIASDKSLSYGELNKEANKIANALIDRGVKRGDSIMLLLGRRSSYFAAMFGVLKAGAAFIPCDTAYPKERIESILSDSGAKLIITIREKEELYPKEKTVLIDELLSGKNENDPDVQMSPDDLAYLIYTSGSTGKPKGVMLRHAGITNYLFPHRANVQYDILSKKVHAVLSVTTIAFDMSLKETTGALCNGKTLVFADESEMNDPRALAELFMSTGADCFNATPSRIQQYMEYPPFRDALKRCTLIMCGGEGYPMELLERLRSVTTASIVNTYGPTEITVSSNGAVLTKADHISVGRPLLNVREYIVDPFGELSAPGAFGELYIGGEGVALGYKNLPEQTAQKFIEFNNERVFKSGDLCRFDWNGNIMVSGRLDTQVKIRGLRIELSEIETVIMKQEGISRAVVSVRKMNGQENLAAYFTADRVIDVKKLKKEISKTLTHYMVPAAYLQIDEFPVTPNGKVDVKNLPEPVVVDAQEYIAPEDPEEEFFCHVFEKILNVEKVGAEDDFFRLGGTSLLATSIIVDAEAKGYNIDYGEVFSLTTPRKLAAKFNKNLAIAKSNSGETSKYEDYDYSKINELLSKNTVASFVAGQHREIGNILLTGATGYLGINILEQYLKEEKGKAYCLVRKGRFESAKERLKNMFFYYFEEELSDEFEKRVLTYEGDVTDPGCFARFEGLDINTVFNCAASVKHFSSGTDIEDINVGGAVNCVSFCKKTGARLIQFSTVSTAGTLEITPGNMGKLFTEQELFFGQSLDNQYVSSKFLGEREVLAAAAEGFDMKVIRVGTLAARTSDGLFQINLFTNSFAGRLRSYALLSCFPYSNVTNTVRMGPIDTTAEVSLILARTPKENCLFHAINNNTVPLDYIIRIMQSLGVEMDFVEDKVFQERLSEAEKNPEKAAILQSVIAYRPDNEKKPSYMVEPECVYTNQVLAREGFFWPPTDHEYLKNFVELLQDYGFFDKTLLIR